MWQRTRTGRVSAALADKIWRVVVSVALALLTGTQAGKEKHEMNIQKLLVCSEM